MNRAFEICLFGFIFFVSSYVFTGIFFGGAGGVNITNTPQPNSSVIIIDLEEGKTSDAVIKSIIRDMNPYVEVKKEGIITVSSGKKELVISTLGDTRMAFASVIDGRSVKYENGRVKDFILLGNIAQKFGMIIGYAEFKREKRRMLNTASTRLLKRPI